MIVRDLTLPKTQYKGRPTFAYDRLCPCRPCWNPHDCSNYATYPVVYEVRMECLTRYSDGCPNPMPNPTHTYVSARGKVCKRCGVRR